MSNVLKQIDSSLSIKRKSQPMNLYSEGEAPRGMVPIYVILTSGTSIVSKMIMKFTNSKYSHCTLCLNYYETISMGTTSKNYGIAVESVYEFPDRFRNGDIKICRKYVPISVFMSMSKAVEKYKLTYKKIKYSFLKITNFFKWVPKRNIKSYRNETSFICSEFVSYILSRVDDFNKILKKQNIKQDRGGKYMLSPKDVEGAITDTFEVVYEGSVYGIPLTFMYDMDKNYVNLKNKLTKDVLKSLGVDNKKIGISKSYSLSYETETEATTEFNIELFDKKLKDVEQNSIDILLSVSSVYE